MGSSPPPRPASDPYRELFERSADAILILEGDTFVDCNRAAIEMLRCGSKAEVLRTHPSELSPPRQPDGRDSFEKANEMIAIARERGSHRFEWAHRRADGEVFPVEVLLTAVEEPERQILHVVWRDITQRRLLETSLRQALKMEAVGKLAGGVAHDFNNLLVVILGHADLLESELVETPELAEHVEQIREAGQRAAGLVRQLLAFGRRQQLLPEVVDVNQLVEELAPLLERLVGEDVELRLDACEAPLHVEADRGQIEQVLMNLASNARDATPGRGVLGVRMRLLEVGSEDADARLNGLSPGRWAVVSVADSGEGMPSEVLARAFDPFFTTKEPGQGTGLGLSTAYGIVQQSGGAIRIDSTPGVGTTVHVYLPVTSAAPAHAPAPPRATPSRGGSERILVVEDEPAVRELVTEALAARGYDVRAAGDGEEGRALFLGAEGGFDLVVSDVIMPRASGPEMVAALEAEGFRPRVLFLSGHTNDALTARHTITEGVDLLTKPFSTGELAQRVRAALDRSPA